MTSLNWNIPAGDKWEYESLIPMVILGKVYSNAMMANLNHRIQIEDGRNDPQIASFLVPPRSLFPDTVVTDAEIRENAG